MDDAIRRYIERALELSDHQEAMLTEQDLAEIARDIGLGDADFARIQQAIEDSLLRGRGYATRGMWDDAIHELEEAAALAPTKIAVQLELARALVERSDGEDRERAEAIARRALVVEPSNDEAFELLAKLDPPAARPAPNPELLVRHVIIVTLCIFALGISGIVAFFVIDAHGDPVEPPSWTPPPPVQAKVELGTEEVELPVEWDGASQPDLAFRARRSLLANYPERSFYTLWGDVEVVGDVQLEQLDVRVQQLSEDGSVLDTDDRPAWGSHAARLRKGDHGVFTLLVDGHRDAKRVKVTPSLVKKVASKGPYEAARVIEPVWIADAPAHLKLEIRERHASFSIADFLKRGTFTATWEMANIGDVPIQKLHYAVKIYDKKNQLMETRKKLATFSSHPPLEPNDVFIENSIALSENLDYDRYEIEILDIE